MKLLLGLFFLVGILVLPLCAQIDSIATDSTVVDTLYLSQSVQHKYHFINGQQQTSYIQTTQYDTNGITLRQKRDYYNQTNTGEIVHRQYLLEYNPNTLQGFYQTEKLPLGNKPYNIQKTTFKNYNRTSNKRYWVKIQKPNSKQLLRQVRYDYDNNGYLIRKETSNYDTKPTSTTLEKVTRNKAGNMLTWVSEDDDGDTKTKARSFKANYLNDTLLLRSDDQLFYNHTTIINQYNKNGQLKKSEKKVGNPDSKGKIKYNNEVRTIYKEGRPYKLTEKNLRKKVRTISYSYGLQTETQQVVTPKKSYTDKIVTELFLQEPDKEGKSITLTRDSKFLEMEKWSYWKDSGLLFEHVVSEVRENNKTWYTYEQYNERGDVILKYTKIDDQLISKDTYEHVYK